ncbi:MAG: VOC family protein [Planctomycetota bacterium]|jgi:predicted enzyme related to lactoylglutathione lyase|nr:VOC family protein [Planctomycetota bacterium]
MQIAYVNVHVSDLGRAVAFYRDVLGLSLGFADEDHGYASFVAGSISLGLAVVGQDQSELLGVHTGVGFSVEDLEAEHERLVGLGVDFPQKPTRQPWGGFMALMADPDGNVFYLDEVSAAHA